MFTLEQDFRSGMKIFQIPIRWFRKVTAFLTHLTGGDGIDIHAPPSPDGTAPVQISVDQDWLKDRIREIVPPDTVTDTPVSIVQTDSNNREGIASATAAAVSGDTISTAAARITASSNGTWSAGDGRKLVRYEIAHIKPFLVGSTKYAKIFIRENTYAPSGRVLSQGGEIDQGLIIQLR